MERLLDSDWVHQFSPYLHYRTRPCSLSWVQEVKLSSKLTPICRYSPCPRVLVECKRDLRLSISFYFQFSVSIISVSSTFGLSFWLFEAFRDIFLDRVENRVKVVRKAASKPLLKTRVRRNVFSHYTSFEILKENTKHPDGSHLRLVPYRTLA